jgi:glycosyltransferase involved in cell wall biosynthesis
MQRCSKIVHSNETGLGDRSELEHYSIAAVLPGLNVFGGIRRYLSLGAVWRAWGHEVTLYTPSGEPPSWLDFSGTVRPFTALEHGRHDLAFTPEAPLLPRLRALAAERRAFYVAIEGAKGEGEPLRDRSLLVYAVSSALRARLARRYGRPVLDGAGAVDLERFRPADEPGAGAGAGASVPRATEADGARPLRVLAFGRRSRKKKGTELVVRAVEAVARRRPELELVLFDHVGDGNEGDPRAGFAPRVRHRYALNPSQDELVALYRAADVFVAAERKAGWCNTAIEAMACGAPVLCTPSGTGDFARHGETAWVVRVRHPWFLARGLERLLGDDGLRARLARAGAAEARRHGWPDLAARILVQAGLGDGVPEGAVAAAAAASRATARSG